MLPIDDLDQRLVAQIDSLLLNILLYMSEIPVEHEPKELRKPKVEGKRFISGLYPARFVGDLQLRSKTVTSGGSRTHRAPSSRTLAPSSSRPQGGLNTNLFGFCRTAPPERPTKNPTYRDPTKSHWKSNNNDTDQTKERSVMRWFVSWVLWTLVMWVALCLYIAWFLSIQRYKPI